VTTLTTTRAELAVADGPDSCPGCGWQPESGQKWPTFGGIAVKWIESNLIFAEGDSFGKPVRLRKDQKLFLWRWYEYCPNPACGLWHFTRALRGEARGGGKTALIAMIAVLEFGGPPQIAPVSPNVVVAAASWDQANLLYSAAAVMMGGRDQEVEQAPLRGYFEVYDSETRHADRRPGRLFRTATVAGTNQGGQPTLAIFDEIHEYGDVTDSEGPVPSRRVDGRVEAVADVPDAGRPGVQARAGPRHRPVDGRVRHRSLDARRDVQAGAAGGAAAAADAVSFDWREAPDGLDYSNPEHRAVACRAASGAADVIWSVAARVAEWDDDDMPAHEWIRYYANRWVDVAEESWLSDYPGAWAACEGTWEITGDEPTVLAVDMALKRDSVAVAEITACPTAGTPSPRGSGTRRTARSRTWRCSSTSRSARSSSGCGSAACPMIRDISSCPPSSWSPNTICS
jgi:Phage terminase-like protein, large subunit